eukprot:TRINITY_DN22775_c0_g1_i1.p1 TRINITY_DN22775_c0_g1~~TRINITY_DN22775_c0_g1_i1.p1  ORF type:complete len:254 (+),score=35.85 TRINITY_DN22775_c0_g1_i1:59-820(+)
MRLLAVFVFLFCALIYKDHREPAFFFAGWSHTQFDSRGSLGRPAHNDVSQSLELLGLDDNTDLEQARSAFRKMARENHPDVVGESADATANFRRIVSAYKLVVRWKKGGGDLSQIEDSEPVIDDISGTTRFDASIEGGVSEGDVVLYRMRDEDREENGVAQEWALALVEAIQLRYTIGAPCGFIYGQQLVRESGQWLVAADSDLILIDPLLELEVLRDVQISDDGSEFSSVKYSFQKPINAARVYVPNLYEVM